MKKSGLYYGTLLLCILSFSQQALSQTLTLTPSNYNGFNISCAGFADGSINMTITGGTPPYTIRWSNDRTSEDIIGLQAGYYSVEVDDSDPFTDFVYADITLTEPEPLNIIELVPYEYQNGYNVSQYGACNGSVTANVTGGVTPYTYIWQPGNQTIYNPTNLCGNENQISVTDNNGCIIASGIGLREPERDDWTMSGNYNSNPANQFIGTLDSKDLVFKTNNTERLRIGSTGLINFSSPISISGGINFGSNKVVKYQPPSGNIPGIFSIGQDPNLDTYSILGCISPALNVPTNYQFNGTIQLYGNSYAGGNLNILEMGFDGANAIIDATGMSNDPVANRLLLNYYCGKDVIVGNSISGNFIASKDAYVNNKLGVNMSGTTIQKQFEVNGDVRFLAHMQDENNGFEISRGINPPTRRGITLGDNPDGSFNFWINSYQSNNAFKFLQFDPGTNTTKQLLTVTGEGHVGIGTNIPLEFQDGTPSNNPSHRIIHMKGENPAIRLENTTTNTSDFVITSGNGMGRLITDKGLVVFLQATGVNTPDNYFTIVKNHSNFSSPISDSDVLFKVNNDGYLGAHGVKVTAGTFPDYVFDDNYDLMDLNVLKSYIETYNRLPGIPSATEIMKEGLDVGKLILMQMEKIEELTLHIIALSEQNQNIAKKLELLESK